MSSETDWKRSSRCLSLLNGKLIRRLAEDWRPMSAQRGNALLIVIGIVGLLAGIAVAYQATTQSQSRMFDALSAKITSEAAADAAVNLGIWRVARDWRSSPELLEARSFLCVEDGAAVYLTIENESRRLNLNLADANDIGLEMAKAGVSSDRAMLIAARIADYVDRDELTADGRPEAAEFAAVGSITSPKNAPLDLIDELLMLPGVDGATYSQIESALSVHSTRTDRRRKPADANVSAEAPARGVYRLHARVQAANGATFARTTIIELDPGRPLAPAVRLWRRGRPSENQDVTSASRSLRACRDVILAQ